MKGVCDTPLHMFGYFTGDMMVEPDDFTRYRPTKHHRRTCNFPAMEGVCDTPLHLFGHFMGGLMADAPVFAPGCTG